MDDKGESSNVKKQTKKLMKKKIDNTNLKKKVTLQIQTTIFHYKTNLHK